MTTLKGLLEQANDINCNDPVALAAAAGYWAGRSAARAELLQQINSRIALLPDHRLNPFIGRIITQLLTSNERNSADGLAAEAAEILAWEVQTAAVEAAV